MPKSEDGNSTSNHISTDAQYILTDARRRPAVKKYIEWFMDCGYDEFTATKLVLHIEKMLMNEHEAKIILNIHAFRRCAICDCILMPVVYKVAECSCACHIETTIPNHKCQDWIKEGYCFICLRKIIDTVNWHKP